jgi:hypothetical protein
LRKFVRSKIINVQRFIKKNEDKLKSLSENLLIEQSPPSNQNSKNKKSEKKSDEKMDPKSSKEKSKKSKKAKSSKKSKKAETHDYRKIKSLEFKKFFCHGLIQKPI